MTSTSKPLTAMEQIEATLTVVLDGIEQELRTPPELRGPETYERLAGLHRREAACWKAYLEATGRRMAWLAASAAADRAHQLAECYQSKAAGLLQDSGQLWPAEFVDEAAA